MPWNFAKLQKQSLGFAVIRIGTYRSVKQEEMVCVNLKRVSDSFENNKVNIRFIQCKHRKVDKSKHICIL